MIGMNQIKSNSENEQLIKLDGLFAFKVGMSTIYSDDGNAIPVTVLKYEPWFVSQIKTAQNDGYNAIQLSCGAKKTKNSNQAEAGHFKKSGLDSSAAIYVKEVRLEQVQDIKLGSKVDIASLSKGDLVKVTGKSKGKGFAGSVKRWNFAGGPASHGSNFHRRPGSSGNRTWPGRVMPGKKFPGQLGSETVTVKNLEIVEINTDLNVLLVKGAVPGARNSLVKLVRE